MRQTQNLSARPHAAIHTIEKNNRPLQNASFLLWRKIFSLTYWWLHNVHISI